MNALGPAPGGAPTLVALDVAALQVEGWADRGVGRYVAGYAAGLDARGALAAGLLDPTRPPPLGLPPSLLFADRWAWDGPGACRRLAGPGLWHHVTIPFLGFETGTAAGPGGVWSEAGVPRATLLHDLIPLRAPRHYLAGEGLEARYRERAAWVAESELILTNSDYTRREAIDVLGVAPERVVTVGVGTADFFSPADGTDDGLWATMADRVGGRPFLFTVAGSDERKGGELAVAALGRLVERGFDLSLLVAGHLTGEWLSRLQGAAAASGVADRVVLLGAVSDDLLRACYRRAEITVFPSVAEGAGLPVLESAACGTPALVATGSALADTAASPLATFDPTDPDDMADAVAACLEAPARRTAVLAAQARVAAGSTWEGVAERALAALAAADPGRPPLPLPLRAAIVGDGGPPPALLAGLAGAEIAQHRAAQVPAPAVLAGADVVVYMLGPGDGAVRRAAATVAGWLYPLPGAGEPPRLEPLVRRSKGVLVDDPGRAGRLRLALAPLAAPPPVEVIDGEGAQLLLRLAADGGRLAAGLTG